MVWKIWSIFYDGFALLINGINVSSKNLPFGDYDSLRIFILLFLRILQKEPFILINDNKISVYV
jgi:hypothetical protein